MPKTSGVWFQEGLLSCYMWRTRADRSFVPPCICTSSNVCLCFFHPHCRRMCTTSAAAASSTNSTNTRTQCSVWPSTPPPRRSASVCFFSPVSGSSCIMRSVDGNENGLNTEGDGSYVSESVHPYLQPCLPHCSDEQQNECKHVPAVDKHRFTAAIRDRWPTNQLLSALHKQSNERSARAAAGLISPLW